MITAKFGGTAMTAENFKKAKNILTESHKNVVVSAIGKSSANDLKVTDMLNALYATLPDVSLFDKISYRFKRVAKFNHIKIDLDVLLEKAVSEILRRRDRDYTLSVGEEITARLFAAYIGAQYFEASDAVKFRNGILCREITLRNLKHAFKGSQRVVTGGFYGSDMTNRVTFPRGGGDITGALVAAATNSTLYENWTDVNGLCVADPLKIPDVKSVRCLTYQDMETLASCGATVLHPDAVKPAADKGIPINIRNIYYPYDAGTLVTYSGVSGQILGITEKKESNKYCLTVVYSLSQNEVLRRVLKFFSETSNSFDNLAVEERFLKIFSRKSMLREIYDLFFPPEISFRAL